MSQFSDPPASVTLEIIMCKTQENAQVVRRQLEMHMESCRVSTESFLRTFIASLNFASKPLVDATEYSIFSGGKRIRPVLVQLVCMACNGKSNDAIRASAAIELVHCFSLVHDDLPALDNDATRRGQPTVHVKFGEPLAILVGDLILSLSHEVLASEPHSELRSVLSHELSVATREMIDGQVIDTLGADVFASVADPLGPLDQLKLMHTKKTGALLIASARMGAICANAPPPLLDAATNYARAIGLMFQIVDDLLDVQRTSVELGKASGKDAAMGKRTFPGVLGIDQSRERVQELLATARIAAHQLPAMQEELSDFAAMLATRTR